MAAKPKQTATPTTGTTETSAPSTAIVPATQAKGVGAMVATEMPSNVNIFGKESGFSDLSLPPILKTADLAPGQVVIGKIVDFGVYDQNEISSALITMEALGVKPDGEFFERGVRFAMPIGAVLGRALGTEIMPKISPADQITKIKSNGFGVGAIIAMQYRGKGIEKGKGKNGAHLWDIKAKKVDGEIVKNTPKG